MSNNQSLRDLVSARLTAAAEEIFALFDNTILKYEEELSRSRQENQEKQQLLDSFLNPQIPLFCVEAPSPSLCPTVPRIANVWTEIKTEPEELQEQLPFCETFGVCVKRDESLPFQQQIEHQDKTPEENGSMLEEQTDDSTGYSDDEVMRKKSKNEKHQGSVVKRQHKTEADVQIHSQVDAGEGYFSCSVCMETFSRESLLNKHKMSHKDGTRWSCTTCKKTFRFKGNLEEHNVIHTGEKPFVCEICNYAFNRQCTLTRHYRTHTDEKPFSCTVCEKSFRSSYNLSVHWRTHTGEKPYSCTVCKKSFRRSYHLTKHRRTHTSQNLSTVPNVPNHILPESN